MLPLHNRFCTIGLTSFLILFSACDNYLFKNPQPVDALSMANVPQEFWGKWGDNENTLIIDKWSYIFNVNEIGKICPNSPKNKYLVKVVDNWVYALDTSTDCGLVVERAALHHIENDTIYYVDYQERDSIGSDFIVKKLGSGYLLNTNSFSEERKWWQLLYINTLDNKLLIMNLDYDFYTQCDTASYLFEHDGTHFSIQDFRTTEIEYFIEQGWFSDTLYSLQRIL